jgi:hypothetical protein
MTIFLWLGVAMTLTGLLIVIRDDWLLLNSSRRRSKGTVVELRRSPGAGAKHFDAVVRFDGGDGRQIEIIDPIRYPARKPAIGSAVELEYPTGQPEEAKVRRPLLRLQMYGFLLFMLAALLSRIFGWLSG